MKTNASSTKILLAALSLAFIVIMSIPVMAAPGEDTSAFPVEVHYLGTVNNSPVLQVSFTRDTNEPMTIRFLNESGETLYTQDFSGNLFSTKYLIDGATAEDLTLTLELYSAKTRKRQVYHINNRKIILNNLVVNVSRKY